MNMRNSRNPNCPLEIPCTCSKARLGQFPAGSPASSSLGAHMSRQAAVSINVQAGHGIDQAGGESACSRCDRERWLGHFRAERGWHHVRKFCQAEPFCRGCRPHRCSCPAARCLCGNVNLYASTGEANSFNVMRLEKGRIEVQRWEWRPLQGRFDHASKEAFVRGERGWALGGIKPDESHTLGVSPLRLCS